MLYEAPGSSLRGGAAGGYSQSHFDLDARLFSGRFESGQAALPHIASTRRGPEGHAKLSARGGRPLFFIRFARCIAASSWLPWQHAVLRRRYARPDRQSL